MQTIQKIYIDKDDLLNSVKPFIDKYNRLPLMEEDSIEVIFQEDDEDVIRVYKASKYIKEFYGSNDDFVKELFEKKIIDLELVSKITGCNKELVDDAVSCNKRKKVSPRDRRKIEIFFNKDLFNYLHNTNRTCESCTKKCKQSYYSNIFACSNYRKSKRKKK